MVKYSYLCFSKVSSRVLVMRMVTVLTLMMVRVRVVLRGGCQEGCWMMRIVGHGVVMLNKENYVLKSVQSYYIIHGGTVFSKQVGRDPLLGWMHSLWVAQTPLIIVLNWSPDCILFSCVGRLC